MGMACGLADALDSHDWDRVNDLLNANFFRYLMDCPQLLSRVFQEASAEWFETYPRHAMSRAIAEAVSRPGMVLDPSSSDAFQRWVKMRTLPAARDVLGVQQARLRELLAQGWCRDASALVDGILGTISAAPHRSDGFDDVMPPILLRCGVAKFLADDFAGAAGCFSEGSRWATLRAEHPIARFLREHLALIHALQERFSAAGALLGESPAARSEPHTMRYHLEPAGIVARILVRTASLDVVAPCDLEQLDDVIEASDIGWAALHARALVTAAGGGGGAWGVIHRINTVLSTGSRGTAPATIAGSTLRADLAGLYQSVGDLAAAESVLSTPGLLPRGERLIISLARQALLRGRPSHALSLLRNDGRVTGGAVSARHLPTGAILYATAELATAGEVSRTTLEFVASTINHHQAHVALTHASRALRKELAPLIERDIAGIPAPWRYQVRAELTPREREVLAALATHPTVDEVAAALHVSPNTVKTHVRALYQKLGAHNRSEALSLAQRMSQ
ncbi:helix-turn-helix transcriptional regulator [Microbacterium testaceum]|uniref:helix-turn-helix transcriptional regulator n=1 Tax=Microbacterium testaceum TaxID=2033 RepID=UPI002AC497B8|nr:helix-turn-helix transcriptional regulator [Microbacterium testaceum]MDZ5146292.1 helix-turn-helix transcriptional regulator [Microbacterium testaceum]